ncbi:MAG: hypothetical protein FWE70_03740 [Oscillospiraceae bacterium]|nr:hypothetical protein [Oscillospiraceae bacterium]
MKTTVIQPHKSSLNLDANVLVLLMYLAMAAFSWIPYVGYVAWAIPLVLFLMEKGSRFVKFSAVQALALGVVQAAISIVFAIIVYALRPSIYGVTLYLPLTGGAWAFWLIGLFVSIAFAVLYIYVIVMAYNYKQIELPLVGPIAVKQSERQF